MTVYADTPRWPRHGTLWGHLISDASLAELHERAARAGLPPRAFDLDHYDWPLGAREQLEAVGVRFVADGELTRILIASGLRIRLRDRPDARARRSAEHAAALGLEVVPRDLIHGMIGHVDPLPGAESAAPGAFRLTQDRPGGPPRVESHDEQGRRAALALLQMLDSLARGRGEEGFVGQVLEDGTSA
ncbi:DUF4031 domain-containing protein [Brachybacterium sp. YJGR34]|uniref:DUF4031 domain-containing protein n=1 Tax=Brachybacterium sp. YJGR34 TaxID=2059911 RepID=UPI000E0A02C4|nr:DUF4031 domain-containing protein [Brachybacterium sp. YJGR34]